MTRSLQEIKQREGGMTNEEQALLTLYELGRPATAKEISENSDRQWGLCSTTVGRALRNHPQVERFREKDYQTYKYQILEE